MSLDQFIDDLIIYMHDKGFPVYRYDEAMATPQAIGQTESELSAWEGLLILHNQKTMLESNLSDLHQRRMKDDLATLNARGAKIKERLRKMREAEKRRNDREKKRDRRKSS